MPASHHSVFLQARCPSCHPAISVNTLKVLTVDCCTIEIFFLIYLPLPCLYVCGCSELFVKVREDADQLRAAELIASRPVVVLSGKGGCGKTEVVSAVISYAVSKINSEKYVSYMIISCIHVSQLCYFLL